MLRAALHAAVTGCEPLRELLSSFGAVLSGPDGLETRSVSHGASLDACHICFLAHILGRPIICFAAAELEYRGARDDDLRTLLIKYYSATN